MSQHTIILCTSEYPPDHGGVGRYLVGLVAQSTLPVRVVRIARAARWFDVFRTLVRVTWGNRRDTTVWCSHIFPIGTACWLLSWAGMRYTLYFHGMDIAIASHASIVRRWIARRIIARATEVYANSGYTADLVTQFCGRSDVRVHHPHIPALPEVPTDSIRLLREQSRIPATARIVLVACRLVERKGVDRVINAFADLPAELDAVLVIVGDGPMRSAWEELARTRGIVDRVRWIGAVPDSELYTWYAASALFALLPRSSSVDFEGFGIVYIEAGWYGIPVIATRTGGIADAVVDSETGFLLPDTDDTDLVTRAMAQLLADEPLRQRMGKRAQEHVQQFFVWNDKSNRS